MSWTSLYEIAPLRTLLKKYVDFRRTPITFPCSKETGLHSPFLLTRLVHFYVAIWHNLSSRSIATRCRKSRCGSGYERWQVCKELGVQVVSGVLSRENMSICWWKSRRIIPSATSCGASRDAHHIGCRREFPDMRKRTWGRHFWARGSFSTTCGNITDDVILQYLREHEPPGGTR